MPEPFVKIQIEIANGKVTMEKADFERLLARIKDRSPVITTTTTVILKPKKRRVSRKKVVK